MSSLRYGGKCCPAADCGNACNPCHPTNGKCYISTECEGQFGPNDDAKEDTGVTRRRRLAAFAPAAEMLQGVKSQAIISTVGGARAHGEKGRAASGYD